MTALKKLIYISALLFGTFAGATPAFAQTSAPCALEDLEPLFCPPVADIKQYERNNLGAYSILVPGKDGWIFRTENDLEMDFSKSMSGMLKNLSELNKRLAAQGTHLTILYTPTRGMMHPSKTDEKIWKDYSFTPDGAWKNYETVIKEIRGAGIDIVDIARPKTEADFFYKRDHHWNAAGAKKAAIVLADHVKKLDSFKGIPAVEFTTQEGQKTYYYGVFKKVFKRLCETEPPAEIIRLYSTERKSAVEGESALFGDTDSPDIVLTGTSNSTIEPSLSNFEGFLKEAMGADILNMSVSGGGVNTAILDYLNSSFYKEKPAKILIWEMPSYYDLSKQSRFFREALPAALNGCKTAVREDKVSINSTSTLALGNLGKDKISGSDYFLKLTFDKPVPDGFTVDLRYMKNRDKYKFLKPVKTESERTFNLAFADTKKEALDKIILEVPPAMTGQSVNVQLCKSN